MRQVSSGDVSLGDGLVEEAVTVAPGTAEFVVGVLRGFGIEAGQDGANDTKVSFAHEESDPTANGCENVAVRTRDATNESLEAEAT
jgi:hypothetical protein